MAEYGKNVDEILEDLKNKIDELTKAGEGASGEALVRINEVKAKSINVLNQVSNKVIETANNVTDIDEIDSVVEMVSNKSKQLYENALTKINELINPETVDDAKKLVKDVKKDINDFFEREEVKNTIESAKEATVEIADKALDTLKEWLKPEDK